MDVPTLRQLEYAVAVADERHFGRAAASVAVSQPGLSSQLRELERRLGVVLFERASGRVRPTAAGAEVIGRARSILTAVGELTEVAASFVGTVSGELRIAAIPTVAPYWLPGLSRVARERWPEARQDIQELQTGALVEAIGGGDVDLGLLAVPVDTASLHVEEIAAEPFVLALPLGHPLAGSDPLPVGELAGLPMLLLPEGHCLRDHAHSVCEIAGRVDAREVHGASLATLGQMVAGGTGVTLLPAAAVGVEARPGTGLTTRPLAAPAPGRTIAMVWRRSDPRHALFAAAAAHLRP